MESEVILHGFEKRNSKSDHVMTVLDTKLGILYLSPLFLPASQLGS